MKSLIRWSTTFGLVGSILFGSFFAGSLKTLALTEAQVAERLRRVPVFTITDAEGVPLVASPGEGEEGRSVAGVFISRQDAQNFLTNLQQSNPDLASTVQVTPLSLAEVYELARSNQDETNRLDFMFIPMEAAVENALTLLQQGGQEVQDFRGVPLFYITGQNGELVRLQRGEEDFIPMFFEREGLETLLTNLRQQQPELTTSTTIGVGSLENLIQRFHETNDPELEQILTRIVLVPPRESVEFIRTLQQQQEGQGQPQQPTQQPAP